MYYHWKIRISHENISAKEVEQVVAVAEWLSTDSESSGFGSKPGTGTNLFPSSLLSAKCNHCLYLQMRPPPTPAPLHTPALPSPSQTISAYYMPACARQRTHQRYDLGLVARVGCSWLYSGKTTQIAADSTDVFRLEAYDHYNYFHVWKYSQRQKQPRRRRLRQQQQQQNNVYPL